MLAGRVFQIMDALYTAVYGYYFACAARGEFQRNVAGAAKQVEHFDAFEINFIEQDIEQRFFGQVGSWAYG